jgi:hypothetical protein
MRLPCLIAWVATMLLLLLLLIVKNLAPRYGVHKPVEGEQWWW